jgi:amino-acid N-acetyltransferase
VSAPRCEAARPEDAAAIQRLLDVNHLPTAGLRDHLDHAIVVRRGGAVVGSAAIEVYADGGLLRSVAVDPSVQGTGFGRELTEAALRLAADLELPALYLLTTTAEHFFPRFGFVRITREEVPASVRASIEFTSACPASAIVMRRPLVSAAGGRPSLPSDGG